MPKGPKADLHVESVFLFLCSLFFFFLKRNLQGVELKPFQMNQIGRLRAGWYIKLNDGSLVLMDNVLFDQRVSRSEIIPK